MSEQLALAVQLRDAATFANFYEGDAAPLVRALQACGETVDRFIYLHGMEGVGKSHLLQACCHAALASLETAMYLPLREHSELDPSILEGMESQSLVALDDVHAVMGDRDWEQALFHFYNRAADAGTRLVVSAAVPPIALACVLPDLQSRLAFGLTFYLDALSDAGKCRALQLRASNRGLGMTAEVAQYLLNHFPRDMSALFAVLVKLDEASLQAKRRLTVPFVKEVLSAL